MFTIIVTTHERPHLLRRTLRSLIEQTYQDFQVIIVSDSSLYLPPYEELLLLEGRYTYVIRSGIHGPAESRNIGVQLAQTDYVMFLDDDDTFESSHLESLANCIGDQRPDIVYCNFQIWKEDRTINPPKLVSAEAFSLEGVDHDSLYIKNVIPNNCLIYRKDVIKDIKHDTTMRLYEDWDFLLQCLGGSKLTYLPIFSVIIHKTISADAEENMRRGNTRQDLVVSTTLDLYKKYKAPSDDVRLARQSFFAAAGFDLDISFF